MRLTSANSVNVGRLLPQMVYYFHAVAQLGMARRRRARAIVFCTPSGNFGNLTAGLMAKRAGPAHRAVRRRDQRERRRAGVSRHRPLRAARLGADDCERDGRRPPEQLRAHAVALRRRPRRDARATSPAAATATTMCATTIRRVYETRGYLLDPAQRDRLPGPARGRQGRGRWRAWAVGIFLATAHPAKFARDRRADRRAAGREAGAAGDGAGAPAAHHPHRRLAGGRERRAGWVSRARSATVPTCSTQLIRHGVRPTERTRPELAHDSSATCIVELRALRDRLLSEGVSETRVRRSRRRGSKSVSRPRHAPARWVN